MLKVIREKKDLKQGDVAELAGISRAAYCNIESGNRRASVDVAQKIAAVLEIPEEKIFEVFYKKTPPT